ncbi:MAG: hypothetical protein IJQ80_03715 [Clostridia bacterium]|nr:hypothetical protein [Clostridia bacterium]
MKKLLFSLIALTLVLTLVVAAFGWPGFLLSIFEPKPVKLDLSDEQVTVPDHEWKGDSDAFTIAPVDGITISAEEDAMDQNRTFNVSEVDAEDLEDLVSPLVEAANELVAPLGGIHIDAGLGADGLLPGHYTMKIDLAARGIPEDMWQDVGVWRRDDNGYYYEYATELDDNGVITLESQQNGVIFWVVSVGVIYLCADVFFPAIGTGLKWFERSNYIYVTDGDKPTSKRLFKLKWTFSSGEGEYIKRKAELLEKGRQKYSIEKARDDFKKENGRPCTSSDELMAYRVKYTEEVFMKGNDPIAVEYRSVEQTLESIRASRSFSPDLVIETAKRLKYAREYLKTLKIAYPTPCITVELVPKITGTTAAGVTVAPLIFMSDYLVLQTEGLVSDSGKYDVLTTTAVHELFHACTNCYKNQNSANLKINEATAQIVEDECVDWLYEKGYISKKVNTSENRSKLHMYAIPLDAYKVTYADGSSKKYSGSDKSDVGYPLALFIRYLMNKFPKANDKGTEWHNVLVTYRYLSGSPTVTEFLKECFGLNDESLTSNYILFARKNQAKFYEKAVEHWNDLDYNSSFAFPRATTNDSESVEIPLDDHDYTIRVRHLLPYASDENTGDISMLLVFDKDFTEKLPDTKLYPLGNTNYKISKYGLFYLPMEYLSDFYNCYMMEVDGGMGKAGSKSSYTMYCIESPETPELKTGDGLLKFTLPDKSRAMEDGYMDGFRVTIRCNQDDTETVKHYKKTGAGKDIAIKLSSLHGPLGEGVKEKDLTFTITVCEYINEKDKTRTYGPESESRRSAMDDLLDEQGAMEGRITISLYWPTKDDLDLHCIAPDGSHIYYSNK